jgi:hypothetical protein
MTKLIVYPDDYYLIADGQKIVLSSLRWFNLKMLCYGRFGKNPHAAQNL